MKEFIASVQSLATGMPGSFAGRPCFQSPVMKSALARIAMLSLMLFAGLQARAQVTLQSGNQNLGAANLCPAGQTTPAPCSQAATFTFTLPYQVSFGTTTVVTEGVANLDFKLSATQPANACTGTVPAGTCSVSVTFAPTAPGQRLGSLNLVDNNGNPVISSPIYGIGQASAIAYTPASQINLGGLLQSATGIAVDAAGNSYIADKTGNQIVKIPAGCTSATCQTTVGGGVSAPTALAVDGAGDVFFISGGNSVYKIFAGCASSECTIQWGPQFDFATSIAVDGAGDIFLAEPSDGVILEYPGNCSSFACTFNTVAANVNTPFALAADAAGDLYVGDLNNQGEIVLIPASCPTPTTANSTCQSPLVTGIVDPIALAVDAAGDLFIADNPNTTDKYPNPATEVLEIPAGCALPSCGFAVSASTAPSGVAVDAAGDVFISDFTLPNGLEVIGSQPPALTFPNTAQGSSSSNTFSIQNVGNQALAASGSGIVVAGAGFSLGSGGTNECASSFSLVPGAGCSVPVVFAPTTGGAATGSVTLTDNALNAKPAATQIIPLSGSSPVVATFTLSLASPSVTIPSGGVGATDVVTVVDAGGFHGAVALSATLPTLSSSEFTDAFLPASTATNSTFVIVAQPGVTPGQYIVPIKGASGNLSASTNLTVNVTGTQTITFGPIPTQTVGTPLVLSATASSGLAVSYTATPSTVCAVSGTQATFVGAGTCSITASQSGNAYYSAAKSVTQSFTVKGNQSFTLSLTTPAVTIPSGGTGATDLVTVVGAGGFSGAVTLSATLPSGFSDAFVPNNPTSTNSTFVIVAGSSVAPGLYNIPINGVSGSLSASVNLPVTVTGTQTITFGTIPTQTVGTPLTLTATASSGLAVSYTASPSTVCTVSGSTATFVGTGTCSITASQAGNTYYTAAKPVTQSFTVQAPTPTFTLTPATASFTLARGNGGTDTFTINPVNGFKGTVNLTVTGFPANTSGVFYPASTTTSTPLVAYVSSNATPGTYPLKITGTSGAVTVTTNIYLVVQ